MKDNRSSIKFSSFDRALVTLGVLSRASFFTLFMNISWEWNMFMDDTFYNTWMPQASDHWKAFLSEIDAFLKLGRFYPAKYLANLLKWYYLPNDPTIFRYFNFGLFLLIINLANLVILKATVQDRKKITKYSLISFWIFLIGSSILHKPLLEIIALNSIAEPWVALFFCFGAICLFSENKFLKYILSHFFFILTTLSKEPTALVFFSAATYFAYFLWKQKENRILHFALIVLNLVLFIFSMILSIKIMMQGNLIHQAYFGTTPWLQYIRDFFYKAARHAAWTSPFIALFYFYRNELYSYIKNSSDQLKGSLIFLSMFGLSYYTFMATRGTISYQNIPDNIVIYCFYGIFLIGILQTDRVKDCVPKYGIILLTLFCFSYFFSVYRWNRFVNGINESKRAVVALLSSGETFTLIVPRGELFGHIVEIIKTKGSHVNVVEAEDDHLESKLSNSRGRLIFMDFPIYMGGFSEDLITKIKRIAGGWRSISKYPSYRIFTGNKDFSRP